MPKVTPIITNFTAGELSPLLDGRVDINKYYSGCKTLENFIILPYGGIKRRPGTYYVGSTKLNAVARLVSFQFSTEQAYILEFTEGFIRFYMDGGIILEDDNVTVYELDTDAENGITYLEEDLFDLQFAQDADTMWIVHPSYKPQKLTRTGAAHNLWELNDYAPTGDPFTTADNYPSCVSIYEQRIFFANTNTDPQKVWASKSGDYENMTINTGDDDALSYTLGSEQVNAIRWLSSGRVLGMGTLGGVFSLSSGSDELPITPTTVVVKRETSYGALGVMPKKIGNQVYYVQRNGKTIREFGYSYDLDEYTAFDATLLAEHITGNEIIDMDYQQSPYNMLWCVRSDGEIAVLTRQIDQEVIAWSRIVTDGSFESVAVIPGDGGDDEVWVVVNRTIENAAVRYVEYFKPMDFGDEQEDAFFVDCGLSYDTAKTITNITKANPGVVTAVAHGFSDGNIVIIRGIVGMTEVNRVKFKVIVTGYSVDTFALTDPDTDENIDTSDYGEYESDGEARKCLTSGFSLDHLEDKEVALLVDGAVSPSKTVSAGDFTILDPVTGGGEIHAGLPYISTIKTMRIEAGSVQGTAQTKLKRIHKVFVRVHESVGMYVGNINEQDEISFREADDDMDKPIPLKSGDYEVMMPSLWDRDGHIIITQEDPLPLNILAITVYLAVSDI